MLIFAASCCVVFCFWRVVAWVRRASQARSAASSMLGQYEGRVWGVPCRVGSREIAAYHRRRCSWSWPPWCEPQLPRVVGNDEDGGFVCELSLLISWVFVFCLSILFIVGGCLGLCFFLTPTYLAVVVSFVLSCWERPYITRQSGRAYTSWLGGGLGGL